MSPQKAILRTKYKKLRAAMTPQERDEASLAIANLALTMDIWEREYYHIFLPIERLLEVNTEYILSILSGKDKHILLPKTNFEAGTMQQFLLLDNTKLKKNAHGIVEPEDGIEIAFAKADIIFIPLLAYDQQGNRLGYGKGFYDRFLAECRPDAIKIGLSFFEPEEGHLPQEPQDIALNYCISTKKIYKF